MAQFVPSPQQTAIFHHVSDPRGGNAIVEAVAGAGKTTTLVKACELMTGGRIALIAYNTKMAKELRERTGHMPQVWSKTFHAFGMNALNFRFKNGAVRLQDPDDKKVRKLIDEFIETKGRKDLTEVATTVAKVVSMAKQRGIGVCFPDVDAEWLTMIDWFDLASDLPEGYEDRMDIVVKFSRYILKLSNRRAQETGAIDFDDMVYLPLVWNMRLTQFAWVLVDEAQDSNPTRREMAKRMLAPGGRLIAVGDPHQAIYGFSGADNDALDQIRHEFRAKTLPLTVTYRCPKAIVDVARGFVNHIRAHESAPQGMYTDELQYAELSEKLVAGDAVLCRYTKYLVSTCFSLIRKGKAARIEGRAIGAGLVQLTRKWKVKKLDALAERVKGWEEREVSKASEKGQERKVLELQDKAETMYVLIERAIEMGLKDADELRTMITSLFDDDVADKKGMITLCSVHRSKGLEWPRVYILGLYELMGRECKQQWQTTQELNLCYVAVTRAMSHLINVVGVKEDKKQHSFGEGG